MSICNGSIKGNGQVAELTWPENGVWAAYISSANMRVLSNVFLRKTKIITWR